MEFSMHALLNIDALMEIARTSHHHGTLTKTLDQDANCEAKTVQRRIKTTNASEKERARVR
eukprot:2140261-Amphidinium_carterae.1